MKATSTCLTTSWWQFGQHQTTVTDAVTLLLFSPSRRSTLEPQSYTMQCQTRSVWYHPGTQHRTFCSMACDFAPFCLVVDVLCNMLCLSVGSLWSSETSSKREGSSASIQRNGLLVLSPALNVPCQRAWREFFFFFILQYLFTQKVIVLSGNARVNHHILWHCHKRAVAVLTEVTIGWGMFVLCDLAC